MCPHPPLLVPAVAAGAAPELAQLRAACRQGIDRLLTVDPDVLCIVGDAPAERWYAAGDAGSFRPYGLRLDVALDRVAAGSPTMPLSLTLGAWLLESAGWPGPRRALGVPRHATDADLARLAADLADVGPRVALLVMGDGSARRSEKAPGYTDPRAGCFDQAVTSALATADTASLAALDQQLGDELLAVGTAAWRLLGRAAGGASWDAEQLASIAPYGVGYFVAVWIRRP